MFKLHQVPSWRLTCNRSLSCSGKYSFSTTAQRFATPATPSKTQPSLLYPPRLLVFHAGTFRNIGVSFSRITAFSLSLYSIGLVAPSMYFNPEAQHQWLLIPATIIGGTIPFLAVLYTSLPYTNFIHLALPSYARTSKEALMKFIKAAPFTTELDLTTLGVFGRARVRRVKIGDLEPLVPRTWHLANLGVVKEGSRMLESRASRAGGRAVVREPLMEKRPWWRIQPTDRFFIGTNTLSKPQQVYWPEVANRIAAATNARMAKTS